MKDFKRVGDNKVCFAVDLTIYNDTVISKVLYHLSGIYTIERSNQQDNEQFISLEYNSKGVLSTEEVQQLKKEISQLFADYKMRDIITNETRNIRDILYVKAFAYGEEFEDFNLIGE